MFFGSFNGSIPCIYEAFLSGCDLFSTSVGLGFEGCVDLAVRFGTCLDVSFGADLFIFIIFFGILLSRVLSVMVIVRSFWMTFCSLKDSSVPYLTPPIWVGELPKLNWDSICLEFF